MTNTGRGYIKMSEKDTLAGYISSPGKARDTEEESMTDLKEQMEIMEDDTEPACPHCGARHKKRTEEEQGVKCYCVCGGVQLCNN